MSQWPPPQGRQLASGSGSWHQQPLFCVDEKSKGQWVGCSLSTCSLGPLQALGKAVLGAAEWAGTQEGLAAL